MTDEVMETPVQEVEQTPVEQATDQAAPIEESAPSQELTEDPSADSPKKSKGVQKRIDELVREREDWKRAALRLMEQQQKEAQPESQQRHEPQGKPELGQYESYDAYVEALTEWKLEQRESQRQQEEDGRRRQAEQTKTQEAVGNQIEKGRDKYDDYDAVVFNPKVPITEAMVSAMLDLDNGHDVAYYLGSNPQEATRIAQLSPFAQAREIGKLEIKLAAKPAKTVSDAPPPITPVGNKSTATKDPAQMTDKEWAEWVRSAQKRR